MVKKQIMILRVVGYDYTKGDQRKQGGEIHFLEPGARQNKSGKDLDQGYTIQKGSYRGDMPKALTAVPGVYEATFKTEQQTVKMYGRDQEISMIVLDSVDKLVSPVNLEGGA